MDPKILPPFSARNRGAHVQIDSDFPESARTGLLHLLHDLVEREYVGGWIDLVRELERIARVSPVIYNKNSGTAIDRARETAEGLLLDLPWERVYDFCERLYGHLTQDVTSWDQEFEGVRLVVARSEVQSYVADELSRLFLEESLAFEFSDGQVERQDRAHTSTKVTRAQVVLGDTRLEFARKHFNKALKYFRHVSQPDPENAV